MSTGFGPPWKRRGSKRLATAACALALVPGVNLVVAPVVWMLHVRKCERAYAAMRGGSG